MTDDELRALVRDAIARHLPASARQESNASFGGASPSARQESNASFGGASPSARQESNASFGEAGAPVPLWRTHPSFGKYLLPTGTDQDGPCLIEPNVMCNHCGFCLSHGH